MGTLFQCDGDGLRRWIRGPTLRIPLRLRGGLVTITVRAGDDTPLLHRVEYQRRPGAPRLILGYFDDELHAALVADFLARELAPAPS
jgi:hypothetical protein